VSQFTYCFAECHYAECHYAECRYAEYRYAECCYSECRYAECRYAECRYAECRYAECRSAKIFPFMQFKFQISVKHEIFFFTWTREAINFLLCVVQTFVQ
jgi:hypothetical protein